MPTYPSGVDFTTWPPTSSFIYQGRRLYGGLPDLDSSWTPISGPRAVLEHVARRIISPPGSYDDISYGFDISVYLNANLLPQELDALKAAVRNEALADEAVDDCNVEANLDPVQGLTVRVLITLLNQVEPFFFVFVLSQDTIPRVYFPLM